MTRRLEQLRLGEHRKLRQAVTNGWNCLKDAERRRIEVPAPQVDLFGEPIATGHQPANLVNLRPLFNAWSPFESAALAHLDSWEKQLAPLVARWERGEDVANEVTRLGGLLRSRRRQLEQHVQQVRAASRFVSELRAPMLAVFSALDACDRVHEGEILPVLLSGDPDSVDSIPRQMTSEDLTRRLRSSIDSEPYYEDEPEPSLWARFVRWITGS